MADSSDIKCAYLLHSDQTLNPQTKKALMPMSTWLLSLGLSW